MHIPYKNKLSYLLQKNDNFTTVFKCDTRLALFAIVVCNHPNVFWHWMKNLHIGTRFLFVLYTIVKNKPVYNSFTTKTNTSKTTWRPEWIWHHFYIQLHVFFQFLQGICITNVFIHKHSIYFLLITKICYWLPVYKTVMAVCHELLLFCNWWIPNYSDNTLHFQ